MTFPTAACVRQPVASINATRNAVTFGFIRVVFRLIIKVTVRSGFLNPHVVDSICCMLLRPDAVFDGAGNSAGLRPE